MSACVSCNREISAPLSASGLCQACATASLRSKSAAVAASMLCGQPPTLAIWWQSLTKTDIPADGGDRVLGYAVGSLVLGPVGAALGGAIAASAGAQAVYCSRIGIVAVEPEAVWVFECANLFLGEASQLEEHHLATMLIAWQTGNYAPETTRIPVSQVSCRADGEGLVLSYGPRVWTIRPFGAPHLVPSQPDLNQALRAINGGVAVPPLREFMKKMASSGNPLEPRLLDAVAADSDYMNRVLSNAAMLNRKGRGVFLDKSAQTPSGFRVLAGVYKISVSFRASYSCGMLYRRGPV